MTKIQITFEDTDENIELIARQEGYPDTIGNVDYIAESGKPTMVNSDYVPAVGERIIDNPAYQPEVGEPFIDNPDTPAEWLKKRKLNKLS